MYTEFKGMNIEEIVTSPAQIFLRDNDDECAKLSDTRGELFHSIVAKLVWIMKRARPDIEVAASYLCSRVSKSDKDDWKNQGGYWHMFNAR